MFQQNLFDWLTRGLSSFCDTSSLITSSSASGVKSIGLPVIGFYFVNMEAKAKLNVVCPEINPTVLHIHKTCKNHIGYQTMEDKFMSELFVF